MQKALLHPVPISQKFKIQENLMDLKKLTKKLKDYEEEEEEEKDRNKESKDIEISAQTYSQCLFFSLNLIFCCY